MKKCKRKGFYISKKKKWIKDLATALIVTTVLSWAAGRHWQPVSRDTTTTKANVRLRTPTQTTASPLPLPSVTSSQAHPYNQIPLHLFSFVNHRVLWHGVGSTGIVRGATPYFSIAGTKEWDAFQAAAKVRWFFCVGGGRRIPLYPIIRFHSISAKSRDWRRHFTAHAEFYNSDDSCVQRQNV